VKAAPHAGRPTSHIDVHYGRESTRRLRARVILLGASNVTRGISTIVETAELLFGGPLDIYCAVGHGRSYGLRSFVLVRSLPSVLDSRFWSVLQERTRMPTYALIGDIGNDVMYGPTPEQIAEWVRECMDRLAGLNAKIVCTSLPMEKIESIPRAHFLIARTVFFPTKPLSFDEAIGRARETMAHVEGLCAERGVPFVPLPRSWYGLDPIHIQRRHWSAAWSAILRHWRDLPLEDSPRARGSFARWLRLRTASPEHWWLFGHMERGRAQPALTLESGTRISLY
jgi:hypothetical protein